MWLLKVYLTFIEYSSSLYLEMATVIFNSGVVYGQMSNKSKWSNTPLLYPVLIFLPNFSQAFYVSSQPGMGVPLQFSRIVIHLQLHF